MKKILTQIGITIFLIGAIYWMVLVISTTILPRGNPIAAVANSIIGQPADFIAKPKVVEKVVTLDDWLESDAITTIFSGATIVVITGLFTLTRGRNVIEKYMLLQAYALPRQRDHWGKVLDSETQLPISFAAVRLLKAGDQGDQNVMQTVADLDGRYRMYHPQEPGIYFIEAQSSGYKLFRQKVVSTLIEGKDAIRINAYLEKENANPARKSLRYQLFVTRRTQLLRILTGFIVVISLSTFTLGLYSLIFHFNFISVGNFIFYGFAFPWNMFVLWERRGIKAGRVVNARTDSEMPNVGMRLSLADGKAVSLFTDRNGMVKFDVEPGEYELHVIKSGYRVKNNLANALKVTITSDGYLENDIYMAPIAGEVEESSALPNPFS
jgi:hypothetical protein